MPTDAEGEVLAALQRVFRENIPSGTEIAEPALATPGSPPDSFVTVLTDNFYGLDKFFVGLTHKEAGCEPARRSNY
jgi:hypothetical protein